MLDVRGTYRAELRDAQGTPSGWLRVRVSPSRAARNIYDGAVPAVLNGPLATAAAAVLDGEVNYIEDHAVNVYFGGSPARSLW